jgi:predicted AlkP superfamily pyrophosphatase or phosphodiesterase
MGAKILLIVGDGMRPEFLTSYADEPFVKDFLAKSVYTENAQAVMPTVTLPCHMTMFHSVSPGRHGIVTNTWTPQVRPVKGLVEVLRDGGGKRSGFYYDWEELRDLARPGYIKKGIYFGDGCEKALNDLTNAVIADLDNLDFVFVHYDYPDHLGHSLGYATQAYRDGGKVIWGEIEKIVKALPAEYGIIVTADHGGHERGHGADIPEDLTIPAIFYGDIFKDVNVKNGVEMADFAPTIAKVFGVNPDPEWEGKSLL